MLVKYIPFVKCETFIALIIDDYFLFSAEDIIKFCYNRGKIGIFYINAEVQKNIHKITVQTKENRLIAISSLFVR